MVVGCVASACGLVQVCWVWFCVCGFGLWLACAVVWFVYMVSGLFWSCCDLYGLLVVPVAC